MRQTLILHLDAPLQSWGIESRYERRLAGEAPSKSAVCGMVCAAMGAARESPLEAEIIRAFHRLRMTAVRLHPAPDAARPQASGDMLADYHTVLETRRASGGLSSHAVLTCRYYHQGKRFVVLLESENTVFLEKARQALANPVWGLWFGRKCCIPAAPVIRDPLMPPAEARDRLHQAYQGAVWEVFEEVDHAEEGEDTWNDQPEAFGLAASSGGEHRRCSPRSIRHGMQEASPHGRQNISHVTGPEEPYFQF